MDIRIAIKLRLRNTTIVRMSRVAFRGSSSPQSLMIRSIWDKSSSRVRISRNRRMPPVGIRNLAQRGNLMSTINLRVNGRSVNVDADPTTPLLYILSDDLALRGPKFGCGLGQCGSCTVIIKGQAVRSCVTPVSSVASAEITTLEGLGSTDKPHPIQKAFIDEQAMQCGFCVNGD